MEVDVWICQYWCKDLVRLFFYFSGFSLFIDSVCDFQDKAPYAAKSAKRKAEYEKSMVAYNKKQVFV